MRLKLEDGTWKTARASERKAAKWVYRKITEQRLDPSIVTLDNPTEGTFKIFPVGPGGREAELTIRLPSKSSSPEIIRFSSVSNEWKSVANPDYAAAPKVYRAAGTEVSLVGADWMEANLGLLAKPEMVVTEIDGNDRELWGNLRRAARKSAREFPGSGRLAKFVFAEGTFSSVTNKLDREKFAILRRELPGQEAFRDRPVEGWFLLPKVGGGKAAVPYRKGEGAVVFAALEGAVEVGGNWAEGAKAWEIENKAFLKPALDVRAELLKATRDCGALTTKSAYIAVETTAQEKGLKQKEMESLYGNQNLQFEEPESSDAPGLLLILAFVAVFLIIRRIIPALHCSPLY